MPQRTGRNQVCRMMMVVRERHRGYEGREAERQRESDYDRSGGRSGAATTRKWGIGGANDDPIAVVPQRPISNVRRKEKSRKIFVQRNLISDSLEGLARFEINLK